MSFKYFKVGKIDNVTTVCFDRAEKANALHMPAWLEMKEIFTSLAKDSETHIIILEASGKNWCAGIDIELLMNFQQFDTSKGEARRRIELRAFILNLQSCIHSIVSCPQPVIAQIQGACVGGGLDIASACDIRYCTEEAFFSIKEIEWGMVADLGSLQRLPSIISPGILNEMAFSGREVYGAEAEKIQLVNRCFTEIEKMKDHIKELSVKIASLSPLAIQGTKEILNYRRDHSIKDSLMHVANYNAAFFVRKRYERKLFHQKWRKEKLTINEFQEPVFKLIKLKLVG